MFTLFDHTHEIFLRLISHMLKLTELLLLSGFFSLSRNMTLLFHSLNKIELVSYFVLIIQLLLLANNRHMANFCKLIHTI